MEVRGALALGRPLIPSNNMLFGSAKGCIADWGLSDGGVGGIRGRSECVYYKPRKHEFDSGLRSWATRVTLGRCKPSPQRGKEQRLRKAQAAGVVVNVVGSNSRQSPAVDELKAQLEALQVEASQVRDRYDSSRARFMRLTKVIEQLQQRAVIDMKLDNEGSVRQLLVEKKKVMRAAELSKRRAHLYENLLAKLGEAISLKETQLMVALSSSQLNLSMAEEPTVRLISPKEEDLTPALGGLERVGQSFPSLAAAKISTNGPELKMDDVGPITLKRVELAGVTEEVVSDCGEERSLQQEVEVCGENSSAHIQVAGTPSSHSKESSCPTVVEGVDMEGDTRNIYLNYEDEMHLREEMEEWGEDNSAGSVTATVHNDISGFMDGSDVRALPVEGARADGVTMGLCVNDGGNLSVKEGIGGVRTRNGLVDEPMQVESDDRKKYARNEGPLVGYEEGVGATTDDVQMLSSKFEEYLLDIDRQVAGVESKLQGFLVAADLALAKDTQGTVDGRVGLAKELLEQVQTLRARTFEDWTGPYSRQKRTGLPSVRNVVCSFKLIKPDHLCILKDLWNVLLLEQRPVITKLTAIHIPVLFDYV